MIHSLSSVSRIAIIEYWRQHQSGTTTATVRLINMFFPSDVLYVRRLTKAERKSYGRDRDGNRPQYGAFNSQTGVPKAAADVRSDLLIGGSNNGLRMVSVH